jgi:NADPH:quinone reductase-like Zn-dependent oxidoreductase
MTTMKAVICTKYGKPDVLQLSEVRKPIPNDDDVLVKIYTTAVTASDCVIRGLNVPGGHPFPIKQLMQFAMRIFMGFTKPRNPILGLVFSGVVEATGRNIETFNKGDEVFGFTGLSRGAYAEYKCVTSQEIESGEMLLKPSNTSHEEAAGILYGGVLATHFMKDSNLKKGQKVLIYGASGAIGTIALQLAKNRGTEVTAVCSTKNFELMTALGADKMLDYSQEDSARKLETYDFIIDAVGKNKTSNLKVACKKSLAKNGNYVSVDDGLLKINPDYLPQLQRLIESKSIKAIIDKIYPIENIVEAHKYVEKGHKVGNVLIRMA